MLPCQKCQTTVSSAPGGVLCGARGALRRAAVVATAVMTGLAACMAPADSTVAATETGPNTGPNTEAGIMTPSDTPGAVANTARDGDIAVLEEFAAAEQAGTRAAWELFLARHPDHPRAALARQRLRALQ